jgi:hypothetical protein
VETADFVIRQDDTAPRLFADLTDGNGNPVTVTGSTVRLHLHPLTSELGVDLDLAAFVDPDVANRVYYDWSADDTQYAGYYGGEWQVTYANTQIETFPNQGWFLVNVVAQLA